MSTIQGTGKAPARKSSKTEPDQFRFVYKIEGHKPTVRHSSNACWKKVEVREAVDAELGLPLCKICAKREARARMVAEARKRQPITRHEPDQQQTAAIARVPA